MTSRSSWATDVVAPVTRATAADTGAKTAIEVTNLCVRYRRNTAVALSGVQLRVPDGETVALIGTNGAGKSTLLRCLVRLIEPTEGFITISGTEVTGASRRTLREIRQDVGFVFQRFHLIPRLTTFHNVVQGAMGRHGSRCAWPVTASGGVRRQAMECLDRVIVALHQIELALRYADRVVGLRNGVVEFDRATRDCDVAQLDSIYAEAVS
jgi:phosphonate transport system ATP-binding protein